MSPNKATADYLAQAAKAYYEGEPFLTDEEYDALASEEAGVGYEEVQGDKAPHKWRMWSLQKAYGDENPLKGKITISSPKLDGAAVSVEYDGYRLRKALTRGNGIIGTVITDKMSLLLPKNPDLLGEVQITGEVVAPIHIKNSRNYAAGALNLKSVEEFATRELKFIAYGIFPEGSSWEEDMRYLKACGFNTVLDCDWKEYPQDGTVYRINDYTEFHSLGFTSKFPRGAYAYKERIEGVVTKLLAVEWNVGRSGVVAPTAVLEPVLVGDAVVSRATLHNMAYIEALGLEIGCNVEIIRSGEIIPRIVKRVETT